MEKNNNQELILWDEEMQTNVNKGFCSPDDVLNLAGEQVVNAGLLQLGSGGEGSVSLCVSYACDTGEISGGTTCLSPCERSLESATGADQLMRTSPSSGPRADYESRFADAPGCTPLEQQGSGGHTYAAGSAQGPSAGKLGPVPTHSALTESLRTSADQSNLSSFSTCLPENILEGINLSVSEVGGGALLAPYTQEEQDIRTVQSTAVDRILYGFDLACERDGDQYTSLDQMTYEYDVACGEEEVQYTSLDPVSYSFDVSCEPEEDLSASVDPLSYEFEVACARDDDDMACFGQSSLDGGKVGDVTAPNGRGGKASDNPRGALQSWPDTELVIGPRERQSSGECSSPSGAAPFRNEDGGKMAAVTESSVDASANEVPQTEQALTRLGTDSTPEMKQYTDYCEPATVCYHQYLRTSQDKEPSQSGMDERFSQRSGGGNVEPTNTSVTNYTLSLCQAAPWDCSTAMATDCVEEPPQPTGATSADCGGDESSRVPSAVPSGARGPTLDGDPVSGRAEGPGLTGQVAQAAKKETEATQLAAPLFDVVAQSPDGKEVSQGGPAAQNGGALIEPAPVQTGPAVSPTRIEEIGAPVAMSSSDDASSVAPLQPSTSGEYSIPTSTSPEAARGPAAGTFRAASPSAVEEGTGPDPDPDPEGMPELLRPPGGDEAPASEENPEAGEFPEPAPAAKPSASDARAEEERGPEGLADCSAVSDGAKGSGGEERAAKGLEESESEELPIEGTAISNESTAPSADVAGLESEEGFEPRADHPDKPSRYQVAGRDYQADCVKPLLTPVPGKTLPVAREGEKEAHVAAAELATRNPLPAGEPSLYTCTKCSVYFQDREYLRRHMLDHFEGRGEEGSAGGPRPFACRECGHTFCDPAALRQHVGLHQARRVSFMEAIQELGDPRAEGLPARPQGPPPSAFGAALFPEPAKARVNKVPHPCRLCPFPAATANDLEEHRLRFHPLPAAAKGKAAGPPRASPGPKAGLHANQERPSSKQVESLYKDQLNFGQQPPLHPQKPGRPPERSARPSASQGSADARGTPDNGDNPPRFLPSGNVERKPERVPLPPSATGPCRYQGDLPHTFPGGPKNKMAPDASERKKAELETHALVGAAQRGRPQNAQYKPPMGLPGYQGLREGTGAARFTALAKDSYSPQRGPTQPSASQQKKKMEVGGDGGANRGSALTYRKIVAEHFSSRMSISASPAHKGAVRSKTNEGGAEGSKTCNVSSPENLELKTSGSPGLRLQVSDARSPHATKRRRSTEPTAASCRPRAVKKRTREMLETINMPHDLPVDQHRQLMRMTPLILLEKMESHLECVSTSEEKELDSPTEPRDTHSQCKPRDTHSQCDPTDTHSQCEATEPQLQPDPTETHSQCKPRETYSQRKPMETHSQCEARDTHSQPKPMETHSQCEAGDTHSQPKPTDTHSQPEPTNSHSQRKATNGHSQRKAMNSHSQREAMGSYSQCDPISEERELDYSVEALGDTGVFWEVPSEDLPIDLMKKSKDLLSRNLLRMFPLEERECPYCPDKFHTGIGLANHVRGHLKRVGISYNTRHFISAEEVTAIEKEFSLQKLKRKALKFRGGTVEKCNLCGASFDSRAGMSSHARAHLRELGVMTWSATSSPIDLLNELLQDLVPAEGPDDTAAPKGPRGYRPGAAATTTMAAAATAGSQAPKQRPHGKSPAAVDDNSPPLRNKVVIIDPDDDEMSPLELDLAPGHSSGESEFQEKNGLMGTLDASSQTTTPKQPLPKIPLVTQGEDSLQSNKLLNSCQLCGTCFETRKGLSSHARFHLRQFGVPDSESSGAPIGTLYELMKRKGISSVLPSALASDKTQSYTPKDLSGLKQEAPCKPLGEECPGEATPTAKSPKLGMNSPPKGQSQTGSATLKKVHPILPKPMSSKSPEQGKTGRTLMNTPQTSGELLSKKLFWSPQDDNTPLNLTVNSEHISCRLCGACFETRKGLSSHSRAHLRHFGAVDMDSKGSPIEALNEFIKKKGIQSALASMLPMKKAHSYPKVSALKAERSGFKLGTSVNKKTSLTSPSLSTQKKLKQVTMRVHMESGISQASRPNNGLTSETYWSTSPMNLSIDSAPSKETRCEFCGDYFENRKGLSSHARSHLRQFGVTEWTVNGSPIDTLKELMKRKMHPLDSAIAPGLKLPSKLATTGIKSPTQLLPGGPFSPALGKPSKFNLTIPSVRQIPLGSLVPKKVHGQFLSPPPLKKMKPAPLKKVKQEHFKIEYNPDEPATSLKSDSYLSEPMWPHREDTSPLRLTIDQPSKDVRCEFCGEYFENRKGLSSHARSHLRQFGVTEWTVNGSPIDTLKEMMKRKGKPEPLGHELAQRELQRGPENYLYEEKPIPKPFGQIVKTSIKEMQQKHLTPPARKVLTYTQNSHHQTGSPLGKKIPMGFVSTAPLKKPMLDERSLLSELKPSYNPESGLYKPKAAWSPQEKVPTTPVIAADTCCELCGHYFENRKALASHARAHLRQFGVTEWHINGSPIDTLREWIRQKPNINLGSPLNCVQDRPLPKPIRNHIKSVVKELPGELCSLPGGKTVKLEPMQPKSIELGFPASPLQKNPETEKMPPTECYIPTDLSQGSITECTPSSSMPSEDDEPHPKKKRRVLLPIGVSLPPPRLISANPIHRPWNRSWLLPDYERKPQKPVVCSENLSPRREEGKEPKTFRPKSEEARPLRVRPVIFPVPKPEPLSLVKFTGNIYTLKCRFCDVEFHGPLSIQEEWVRHLQRHILDMNFPKAEVVREEISVPAVPAEPVK
uniref:uncharacterized protein isoform X3 n=1 Tax=Pristiophorus japonicus TaxID=55135 RepID=UPI00398EC426